MSTPSVHQGRPKDIDKVGTLPASAIANGVTVRECGMDGPVRQTVFTFTNVAFSLATSTNAYASQQIYDFPKGRIRILDCVGRIQETTTSAPASTLNGNSNALSWGIGTAAASSVTLATTMMNALPGSGESVKSLTPSTTINVAGTAATGFLAAVSAAQLAAIVDGTATAADLYLNIGVPTSSDIDAAATLTISGHAILTWINDGVIDALTE